MRGETVLTPFTFEIELLMLVGRNEMAKKKFGAPFWTTQRSAPELSIKAVA